MGNGTEDAGLRVVCDQCKGNMAWDAASARLKCQSCGALKDPPSNQAPPPAGGRIVKHDLSEALANRGARGRLGAGARQVKCNECGAVVEFADGITATKCAFCDSPQVLAQEAREDLIRPESLVPFAISRDASVAAFKTWLGKLWFRPSDLKDKANVSELRGVYVPWWTFDCEVTSDWNADAGYHYYVTEEYTATENGQQVTKTRQVQRTRWEPASGRRHDSYDDHLVCASKGLPDDLQHKVADFDVGGLAAYLPSYLQGFSAESYAIELPDAWTRASTEIGALQVKRCSKDVPGDTQRNLRASHEFSDRTFKHVLLPVWIAAFRYNDKIFRVLVNGQTGHVAGKAPISWTKIVLFSLTLIALGVGLWLLLAHR